MFLGFKLLAFFGFILLALVLLGKYKSKLLRDVIIYGCGAYFFFILLSFVMQPLTTKIVLDKDDYYGSYVIDTTYFDPIQAKWQYDHFRFEIKRNNSIYFYVTEKETILRTYKGTIETHKPFTSEVLSIQMEQPTHHILTYQPTIWRDVWDFTLAFKSPKFSNLYFIKGKYSTDK